MKELSIIMPVLNEKLSLLKETLKPLLTGIKGKNAEIIIIDNSKYERHTFNHPQIRHIRNRHNLGVGLSFNLGVELTDSERIVLMGCDIQVQKQWYSRVIQSLDNHPSTIFNSRMSGYTDMSKSFRTPRAIRHGAFLLYKVTRDDLPTHSLLKNDPKFSKILQAKWNPNEPNPGEEYGSIKCLLGAFYYLHKSDYLKLRPWSHHKQWGSLEGWLSLLARAHGMKLMIDKKIEVAHYFGRLILRPGRPDFQFFNQLWMAHTMFSDSLRDELILHLRYGGNEKRIEKLNFNKAAVMIKRMHGAVQKERDYNNYHFKYGLIKNIETFEKYM